MKVKIEFNTDNAAFDDNDQECARILKDLTEKASEYGIDSLNGRKIFDVNGNSIGKITVK